MNNVLKRMNTRDLSIDYLRFIGLSLIMLAHANAPFTLSQIRCFDVPLMIFVSGLTASQKTFSSYCTYLISRTKRLLVPVYIFLTIYLLALLVAQSLGAFPMYVDLKMVRDSYLLLGGIGYVWVIRVFLLVMLVTPMLVRFERYCKSNILYVSICLVLFILNDAILYLISFSNNIIVEMFFVEYVMYLIGYVPLFMLGLRMRFSCGKLKLRYLLIFVIITTFGILIYERLHGFPIKISPQYKYPPQSYFLLYGAVISLLLWYCKEYIIKMISVFRLSSFAAFVGKNTIWIYLWHIPFVLVANQLSQNWIVRFIIIYISPLLIFAVQNKIINRMNIKLLTKYFIG